MLKLLRGTGTTGLAAMQVESGDIVRPLLAINRADIEKYCATKKIEFRFDQSNLNLDYLRNNVRQVLLPLMAEYNPNIIRTLSRTAAIIQADERYLQDVTVNSQRSCVDYSADQARINKIRFIAFPTAIQRRLIRLVIATLGCRATIAFEKVEQLRQQATGRVSTVVEIVAGLSSRNHYEYMELCYNNKHQPEQHGLFERDLSIPGLVDLGQNEQLKLELLEYCDTEKFANENQVYYFDYDRLQLPLIIRARDPGDIIQLAGGRKSLKKLFIDKKIPCSCRATIPVVCDARAILAIIGVIPSSVAQLSDWTSKVLKITYIKETKNAR